MVLEFVFVSNGLPKPGVGSEIETIEAYLRETPYPWNQNSDGTPRGPADDLAAARRLIEKYGYWRRKEELEDAEEASKFW